MKNGHLDTIARLAEKGIDIEGMTMREILNIQNVVARVIWNTWESDPASLGDTLRELYNTLDAMWRVKLDEVDICIYRDEEFEAKEGLSKEDFLLKSRQEYLVAGAKDLDSNELPWFGK